MNTSVIRYLLGYILKLEGFLLLLPCIVAGIYYEKSGIYFLIVALMDQYEANFHKLREIIAEGSSQKMIDYFQDSKNYRDSLTLPGAKIRKDFHEIFVDIADEAGGIAVLASLLAFNGINIKNIGIINNREFEEGVLRIEFYDEDALESAISVLKERNYTIHRR